MKNIFNTKTITLSILAIVLIYFTVNNLVDARFTEVRQQAEAQLEEQQALVIEVAEAVSRNGVGTDLELAIRDCTIEQRERFEDLLDGLDLGLSEADLIELERLFGRCGSFSSDRKSVMVYRLEREVEVLESYILNLETVTNNDLQEQYNLQLWRELSAEESRQSEYSAQLVVLQDQIITALLDGSTASSPEILEILEEVREVRENLQLAITKSSQIRNDITSI